MTARHLDADEYGDWIGSPYVDEELADPNGTAVVVVHDTDPGDDLPRPGALPVVVCAVGESFGARGPDAVDLVVGRNDVDEVVETVGRSPLAAATVAALLRGQEMLDVDAGLAAESAAYSLLQSGPEFARWRSAHPPSDAPVDDADVVRVERDADVLSVRLHRPHRHNAITSTLRDELVAALAIARLDDTVTSVVLEGEGPSFCSGGDLDEFGRRPDPATAHVVRLARSPGREIARLPDVTARIHGATLGGGIEWAAFARHVVADPETRIGLPEVGLGLIPGAGGTVSVTRRIGRQRTAAMAVTCRPIDALTALDWGLVDEVAEIATP